MAFPRTQRTRRNLVVLVPLVGVGCGLRSEPVFEGTATETTTLGVFDVGGEGREGSCSDPINLPFQDGLRVNGLLKGISLYEGGCGDVSGPEDVYRLAPSVDADVTLAFDPERTLIDPVLVVYRESCRGDGDPLICDASPIANGAADKRRFFGEAGVNYSIVIESGAETAGAYRFEMSLVEPALSACPIHDEVIVQAPASTFSWQNEFPSGYGRVDSQCGGRGKENVFTLRASYAGTAQVEVVGSGGLEPVVNLRQGCGTLTELDCVSGGAAVDASFFIPGAGTYYLVVDSLDVRGGSYDLEVTFD